MCVDPTMSGNFVICKYYRRVDRITYFRYDPALYTAVILLWGLTVGIRHITQTTGGAQPQHWSN